MRLPTDPTQWGVIVIQNLVQKVPALEPYIQLAHLIEQPTPDGDGFGVVPLLNGTGFVPFTVKGFELSPLDLLITVENGEEKFTNLNEGSAIMAAGGITMGEPTVKLPPGASQDVALDFMPPYEQGWGADRNVVPGRYGSISPVKMGRATPESAEAMLKAAGEQGPETLSYMAGFYRESLQRILKEASPVAERIFTLDPLSSGHVRYMQDGLAKSAQLLSMPDAAIILRELGHADKVATLMADGLILIDDRPAAKEAKDQSGNQWSHWGFQEPYPMESEIKEPGWYKIAGLLMRVFRTTYLNGRPCTYWLAVHPTGYKFAQRFYGHPHHAPDNVAMRGYYRPAHLQPGEMAFLIQDTSGEASIPFEVEGGGIIAGDAHISVRPMLGNADRVRLSFGPNQHRYPLNAVVDQSGQRTEAIAMPRKGFTPFGLAGKELASSTGLFSPFREAKAVSVRLFCGGGVFSIKEDGHVPYEGLNRGQLAAILMRRYGMPADMALDHVINAGHHIDCHFHAVPIEEPRRAPVRPRPTVMKAAAMLWHFVSKLAAFDTDPNSERVKPKMVDTAPEGSGPGPVGSAGQSPNPAQMQGQAPASVPSLANTGAALMPDIPNLQEVADLLTSYATGSFAPDELGDIYTQLSDKLEDVCDLVGRVLLLARLGKVDFVTEGEAKRLLEEADKLRASLLNADMLLKGVAATA